VWGAECSKLEAVNDYVMRVRAQPVRDAENCTAHGQHGGMIHIDPIDFARRCGSNTNSQRHFPNATRESFTRGAVELLGIVHTINGPRVGGHDNRACDNGAREGAPSYFIDTSQQRSVFGAQVALNGSPA
jgi:hypothetical protein